MVDATPRKGGTYLVDPQTGNLELVPGSITEPRPTQAELEAQAAAKAPAPKAAPPKASEPATEPTSKP